MPMGAQATKQNQFFIMTKVSQGKTPPRKDAQGIKRKWLHILLFMGEGREQFFNE